MLKHADKKNWDELARAQESVSTLMASLQDDPAKLGDLPRAKWAMGLGHPIDRAIPVKKVERLVIAIENLKNTGDRKRLAKSLNLMGDVPFAARLAKLY